MVNILRAVAAGSAMLSLVAACSGAPTAGRGDLDISDSDATARPRQPAEETTPREREEPILDGAPASPSVDGGSSMDDDDSNASEGGAEAAAPSCEGGPTVYAFQDGDRWAYSTSTQPPAGFVPLGAAFRLAKSGTSLPTHELHLLYNTQTTGYLVSQSKYEGSDIGFVHQEALGRAFSGKAPMAKPLFRFIKQVPLRHYVSTELAAPSGFAFEGSLGYVCPL